MDPLLRTFNGIVNHLNTQTLFDLALTLAIALVVARSIPFIVKRIILSGKPLSRKKSTLDAQQRRNTLASILTRAFGVILWFLTVMVIMSHLGVNVTPFLAGASIAGVALGFGAQALVKDIIAGMFVVVENQYRVGDVVTLGTVSGRVEDITLRVTVLRDLDGVRHFIPNGMPLSTANMTYEFSGINLDVGVDYSTDIELLISVVNKVGEELASDPEWKPVIIDQPKFERIDNFADYAMIIKILGRTQPLQQWAVAGELRKRLKIAFDAAGIRIPLRVFGAAPTSGGQQASSKTSAPRPNQSR